MRKEKFLFFSPFSGAIVHAFPEALIADTLQKAGHEVTYVTCGKTYTECTAMAVLGAGFFSSPERRRKACDTCQKVKIGLRKGFGFPGFDLREKLTPEDFPRARARAATLATAMDLYQLEDEGVPVGKIASFEFFTSKKLSDMNVVGRDLEHFREWVVNVLVTLYVARRVMTEVDPDSVVVYSAEYCFNGIWGALCRQRGKKLFSVQSGTNCSNRLARLYANRDSYFYGIQAILKAWPENRNFPISEAEAREVANHFTALFESFSIFAYSAPKSKEQFSIRKHFGVRPDQKVCVAALSSKDEMFAAQMISQIAAFEGNEMPFASQEHWVDSLIEWFRDRPHLFLLIRVHPREYPGKRDTVVSQNYERLQAQLVKLPPNVKVNWPTDEISLYDVMEETDVFLTGWTNAGKEMSFFGLPVVTYCADRIYYPKEFTYAARDREDFFLGIEKSLEQSFDPGKTVLMFRWLAWELIRGTFWIGDSFLWNERSHGRSFLFRALNKLAHGNLLTLDIFLMAKRRKARLLETDFILRYFAGHHQSPAGLWHESATAHLTSDEIVIKREMRRVYQALYGSESLAPGTPENTLRSRLHRWLTS